MPASACAAQVTRAMARSVAAPTIPSGLESVGALPPRDSAGAATRLAAGEEYRLDAPQAFPSQRVGAPRRGRRGRGRGATRRTRGAAVELRVRRARIRAGHEPGR